MSKANRFRVRFLAVLAFVLTVVFTVQAPAYANSLTTGLQTSTITLTANCSSTAGNLGYSAGNICIGTGSGTSTITGLSLSTANNWTALQQFSGGVSADGTHTLTLPAVTDTVVGRTTTDTLTNKTLTLPVWTNSVSSTAGMVGYSSVSGTLTVGDGTLAQALATSKQYGVTNTGAISLTTASSILVSDVTMTVAGTYYAGPSISLAAGTWQITGQWAIVPSSGDQLRCVIGPNSASPTNGISESDITPGSANIISQITVGYASPSTTTTYYLNCTDLTTASKALKGDNALDQTWIKAVRSS